MKRTLVVLTVLSGVWGGGTGWMGCEQTTGPGEVEGQGVLVLNEGAFGQSNAELTFYAFADGSAVQNVFSGRNPGKVLGDVANHMLAHDGSLYVVVNNSNKIEVLTLPELKWEKTIILTGSPRQMAVVGDRKAYVTNMDSTVGILDVENGAVTGMITVGMFPEGIAVTGGKAYVAVGGFGSGENIVVIDVVSDQIVSTIRTGYGPSYIAPGIDGRLYVSCTGYSDYVNPANDTDGRIVVIDPATDSIVDSLIIAGHPGKIAAAGDGSVYVIGPGSFAGGPVLRVGSAGALTSAPSFIDGSFYALEVDPLTNDLYLGDAMGFSGNGVASVHRPNGAMLAQFECGVGPTAFVVLR